MPGTVPKLRGIAIEDVVRDSDERLRLTMRPARPLGPGPLDVALSFPPQGLVDAVWCFRLVDGSERFAELPRVGRNCHAGVVTLPQAIETVTLEVSGSGELLGFQEISLSPLGGWKRLLGTARRLIRAASRELSSRRGASPGAEASARLSRRDYAVWRERFDERPDRDRDLHAARAARLSGSGAEISLLMRVEAEDGHWSETISSLTAQIYQRWQLILLVEPEARDALQLVLDRLANDGRITVAPAGGSFADSCNAGLALARGTHVGIIPSGSCLPSHALTEIALAVAAHPNVELLYTDEDRLGAGGQRRDPIFKPDWSPDFLRARDYLGYLTFYRTDTLRRLGGWRPLDGAEEFDARLRISDASATTARAVLHVPKVLVHLPEGQDAGRHAGEGAAQALADHVQRRRLNALVRVVSGRAALQYEPPRPHPLVSIIIPTKDQAVLLQACIRSVLDRTDYEAFEIIVVDNRSEEPETFRAFDELARNGKVRIAQYPHSFNYSAINNFAARQARGEYLVLLNNDVEVVSSRWLSDMVAHASRPDIGCVGAKLLYPDGTVQHGGVILGVAGLAGHAHRYAPTSAPGYLGRLQLASNMSAVTGACLAVRHRVFRQVGGLDEAGLATAFNDIDFCLKVREAGYLNIWLPEAVLVHHESKSRGYERTPAKRARLAAEEEVMRRRWGRALLEDPYYSPHLTRVSEDFRVRRE